jgi:hypothetical protein
LIGFHLKNTDDAVSVFVLIRMSYIFTFTE